MPKTSLSDMVQESEELVKILASIGKRTEAK